MKTRDLFIRNTLTVAVLLACLVSTCYARRCRVIAPSVVTAVPIVTQNFFYSVGESLQVEALIEKRIRGDADYREFREFKAFKAEMAEFLQWKQAKESGEVRTVGRPSMLQTYCARCHSAGGDNATARAGFALETDLVTADDRLRAMQRVLHDDPKLSMAKRSGLDKADKAADLGLLLRELAVPIESRAPASPRRPARKDSSPE